MAVPIVLDSNTAYVTSKNIKFPGTQTQATAAETAAQTRINDALPTGVAVTVTAGTLKLAT